MRSSIPNTPEMSASETRCVESGDCFTDVEQDLGISHRIGPDKIPNICCSESDTSFCYSSCCWWCIEQQQFVKPPPNITAAWFLFWFGGFWLFFFWQLEKCFSRRDIFQALKIYICSCGVNTPSNGLLVFRPKYQKPVTANKNNRLHSTTPLPDSKCARNEWWIPSSTLRKNELRKG